MQENTNNYILKTAKARCRDCYRCVRACPVKAIGIKDNQAFINEDKCVLCGTCVRECPQKAKVYQNDVDKVKLLLRDSKVIVSLAPSFSAIYDGWKSSRIPAALRKLGFYRVEETSIGADIISSYTKEMLEKPNFGEICSACPAVVSYVEKYMSDNISILMDVVSPMIAHGKNIKQKYNDATVVFIGPCIAKKAEAQLEKNHGVIDAALTFDELDSWLEAENILLNECPESGFDGVGKSRAAKLFALPGGMIETTGLSNNIQSLAILHTSGSENIKMILQAAITSDEMKVVEPLFCSGGCIGGPGITSKLNIFQKRSAIMKYSEKNDPIISEKASDILIDISTTFIKYPIEDNSVGEDKILECYEQTGKTNPDRRLDCGACGYTNCRENAIAVINGLAEVEMCLPYMRRLAEKRADKIIESSPNGIVILDENMLILSMNSSFKKYFSCTNTIVGRPISYLCDDKNYNYISNDINAKKESMLKSYGREFHHLAYYLQEEKQYVGIYVDVSQVKLNEAKLEAIKAKTLNQVQRLLQHQVNMAQEMTMLLGESTAKSESLMEDLLENKNDN